MAATPCGMSSVPRDIDARFLEAQDALGTSERVERAFALAGWARDLIAQQILAHEGPLPPAVLKLKLALRLCGCDPAARTLLERALRNAPR